MLELKFTDRVGGLDGFTRGLIVRVDKAAEINLTFAMVVEDRTIRKADDGTPVTRKIRVGKIHSESGKELWSGDVPDDAPPTRAIAVAAGLCPENGVSNPDGGYDVPTPKWLVK